MASAGPASTPVPSGIPAGLTPTKFLKRREIAVAAALRRRDAAQRTYDKFRFPGTAAHTKLLNTLQQKQKLLDDAEAALTQARNIVALSPPITVPARNPLAPVPSIPRQPP